MKKKIINIIYIISIIVFTVSCFYIVRYFINVGKTKSDIEEIRKVMDNNENVVENITVSEEQTQSINPKIEQLKKVQEQNNEIVAWIKIDGTEINYPVLQTNNNEYYLKRDYKKEYNPNGSIFLDYRYNFERPSDNFLIYGHNNNNGLMFDDLLEYEDKGYYESHPEINLTTTNEDAIYRIIAVFKGQAYQENEFLYYNYIDFENDEEFYDYIENCRKKSLYNINANIDHREKMLTLSTCEYSKKDGRLAIVAIKDS